MSFFGRYVLYLEVQGSYDLVLIVRKTQIRVPEISSCSNTWVIRSAPTGLGGGLGLHLPSISKPGVSPGLLCSYHQGFPKDQSYVPICAIV